MSKTHHRVARKGETHRPVVRFWGQTYETTASPTFIRAGQKVRLQLVPGTQEKRIVVAPEDKEGWETFETV